MAVHQTFKAHVDAIKKAVKAGNKLEKKVSTGSPAELSHMQRVSAGTARRIIVTQVPTAGGKGASG